MLLRFLSCIALIIIFQTTFAQDPCKSYPMNGYTGKCNLTTVFSFDGKFVYTSDMATLKKWDIKSRQVVDELKPFPYQLHANTPDPRVVIVREGQNTFEFDLVAKTIIDKKEKLYRILTPAGKKAIEKLKDYPYSSFDTYFSNDSTFAVIGINEKLYRIDLTTNKMVMFGTYQHMSHSYIPEISTLVSYNEKGLHLINVINGSQLKAEKGSSKRAMLSPDKKYVILFAEGSTVFIDRISGRGVFATNDGGEISLKADGTGFMVYRIEGYGFQTNKILSAAEYSYPSFTLIKETREPWMDKKDRNMQILLDADRKLFYLHSTTWNGFIPLAVYGHDLQTGAIKDSVSFRYIPNAADAGVEARERKVREKIGNNALEKLVDMKTPPYFHSIRAQATTHIDDYTDDGLLLLRDKYFQGGVAILWSFPEGKPLFAFCDDITKTDDVPASATVIPGQLQQSFLSPSGKVIGFNSDRGAYIYKDGVLKATVEKQALGALLDDQALVWSIDGKGNNKDLLLISTETGKVVQKVKSKSFSSGARGDTKYARGKIFFPFKSEVGVLDLANPAEIIFFPNAEIEKSGYMRYDEFTDRVTGKKQIIPDLKPTDFRVGDHAVVQNNYLINGYMGEGFKIYDFAAGKFVTDKTLYSGWMKFTQAVYFKNLGKLLALSEGPQYTWPKAKEGDPGASAFTIDVKTGDITPYLLTDNRAQYISMVKGWEQAAYQYAPKTECERLARKFAPDKQLSPASGNGPTYVVLGFDCEKNAYVVAQRELLFPGTNSTVQVSRLHEKTEDELNAQQYHAVDNGYHICPVCNGYPAGFKTEYYSGWSEWEQKSLNIHLYTRKWETTKSEVLELCKRCKGEAWVK